MENTKQNKFESCAHQIPLPEPGSMSPSPGVPVAPIEIPENNSEPREIEGNRYLTGIKLVMLVSAVTLVNFLTLLDLTIIVTAIPSITLQFHSLRDLGWYGSAYQISGYNGTYFCCRLAKKLTDDQSLPSTSNRQIIYPFQLKGNYNCNTSLGQRKHSE
ncbi:uncharacterized protein N7446_005063 [Penicillium canescens]|uniref:Uncharacterized protein n=1 Tax=Penicillium canescens TaxID=5083 RepID=A0AAD6N7G1_PENCN|nr:uncharacterized protein N7446_005063 [Penicillium canescens]KAJ6038253.1 hypothetical protein N7460_008024 [Penicillium canescens]KAJ6068026.1 hypothetical protein N7446_005063 [Penicillium canescens]KAJ6181468.1 hypothetical protein N7485_000110 [Penicillium canescens]